MLLSDLVGDLHSERSSSGTNDEEEVWLREKL